MSLLSKLIFWIQISHPKLNETPTLDPFISCVLDDFYQMKTFLDRALFALFENVFNCFIMMSSFRDNFNQSCMIVRFDLNFFDFYSILFSK